MFPSPSIVTTRDPAVTEIRALLGKIVTGDRTGVERELSQISASASGLAHCAALAAANGQIDVLELLHAKGADIHANDQDALRLAAAGGWLDVVRYLHAAGADLSACGAALAADAARYGRLETLRYLHDNGCSLSSCEALIEQLAVDPAKIDLVRYLSAAKVMPSGPALARLVAELRTGRMASVRRSLPGNDAPRFAGLLLEVAARRGSWKMLRFIHQSGAAFAGHEARALVAAAESGDPRTIRYIVENVGARREWTGPALAAAVSRGHLRATIYLSKIGAPSDLITKEMLERLALDEQYEVFDFVIDWGKLDAIAASRHAIEEMVREIHAAAPVYRPSKLWEFFNEINLEQLRRFGMRRFKRCVNQNYFNYVPLGLSDAQLAGLLRDWLRHPSAAPLRTSIADPDRYPRGGAKVWRDRRVFQLWDLKRARNLAQWFQRNLYRFLVGLLWRNMQRHDALGLHRELHEPTLGAPIEAWLDGRLISQDLAHSVVECNSILDGLEHAPAAPLKIAEIGPGYGRVGDVLLSTQSCRYFVFDIPPSLYIAQWYLTRRHPLRRPFLFRHFERFEDVRAELEQAEIAFFSVNQIELIPERYFDVGVNISSLHEMRPEQLRHVLEQIYRVSERRVYIKQYRHYVNPWDKLELSESSYFVPEGWSKRFWRADAVDARFFEAALVRDEPPAPTPTAPAVAPRRPSVGVLLANYNDAPFLRTSLEAILAQTDPADEIVVVDDGSTDGSAAYIELMLRRHPNACLLRTDKNQGQHAAIQRALLAAQSDYVLWASADDLILPEFVERGRAMLERHPGVGVCFSRLTAWRDGTSTVTEFTEHNHGPAFDLGECPRHYSPKDLKSILRHHYLWISGNTVLARRDALLEAGGFPLELRWHADWFAFYAIALRHGACSIPQTLALMRERPATYSRSGMNDPRQQARVLRSIMNTLKRPCNRDLLPIFRACPSLLSPLGRTIVIANLRQVGNLDIVLPLLAWHVPRKVRALVLPRVSRAKQRLGLCATQARRRVGQAVRGAQRRAEGLVRRIRRRN